MTNDLDRIEKALVSDPFNETLRDDYAKALSGAGRHDDACRQYDLLLAQFPQSPDATARTVRLARCHHDLGRDRDAVEAYSRARGMPGFERDDALEALSQRTAQATRLQVVRGSGNVVQLDRDTGNRVTFADVAGMEALKKTLRMQVVEPFRNPGLFQRFRKKAGGGVLLYGPPGCGKTLIARAIAGECRAGFHAVGISDILSMWIGESERNLAATFDEARSRAPFVLFFDELDALAYSRAKSHGNASRSVVNEFLSQLDGFNQANDGVLVLAATNMPWDVDPAMKRPGRFARQVFVPPPDDAARAEMLRNKLTDVPHDNIDYARIASAAQQYSGADIDGLIDLAKEFVLAEILETGHERDMRTADFTEALSRLTPTTLDWLNTARNLVKFAGNDGSYKDVEAYLRKIRRI